MAPSDPRAPAWYRIANASVFFILSSVWSGLVITEQILNNVLPLTLSSFTRDAAVIGLVLAIHPLFGFTVQPAVGILSDRIWTRLGRRAFFLVVAAPLVALFLFLIPHAHTFWQLVAVVFAFNFFQGIVWGAEHPLMADMVPPEQRTLIKAATTCVSQLTAFGFLQFGMGWFLTRFGLDALYNMAAVGMIVLIALPALFLREHRVEPVPRPRLTLKRYVTDFLGEKILRRFGYLAFTQSVLLNVVTGFVVLFAVQTIALKKADFGQVWSWQSLPALFFAIPLGYWIERLPKHKALAAGYATSLVACLLGIFATNGQHLLFVAVLFGLGFVTMEVTQKPFFSEFLPKDLVGQLSGAYNVCYAFGRVAAHAGGGALISLCSNNYRIIWIVSGVCCVLAFFIALSIPDRRHAARQAAREQKRPSGNPDVSPDV